MTQKLLAELVGTFAIVFIGAGSVIATGTGIPGSGLVAIALAYGLVVAVMVSAVGHVSGGHFNPAVTIGAWVTQRIPIADAVGYLAAQVAGAAAGAFMLRAALPEALWRQDGVKLGTPLVNPGISNGQAILIESLLTFFLVWVIFATAIDPEGVFTKIAGLATGFVIVFGVLMGGPFTGASMNPVRTLGPALAGGYWEGHWVYWLGPVAGGIVAAVLYDLIILRNRQIEEHGTGAHGEPEIPGGGVHDPHPGTVTPES